MVANSTAARRLTMVRVNIHTPHVRTYVPSDRTRMLVIDNARPQDSGMYGCTASVMGAGGPLLQKTAHLWVTLGKYFFLWTTLGQYFMDNIR